MAQILRMTCKDLNASVRFLVSNTFLCNRKSIYRQKIGIPMGTNCAPVLANLYLYFYESIYVSHLELKEGPVAADTFQNTFRLIDDVLSVDNPLMAAALSKPYE